MNRFRSWFVLLVVAAALLLAVLATPSIAQEATPGVAVDGVTVLEPDETYAGVSRGEWDARWWQWTVSLPREVNPSLDPGGEGCGYGQWGPMLFLPANFTNTPATSPCVVAEGTAIFVIVGGAECSTVEPPPFFGGNKAELRACAAAAADDLSYLQATINGEKVPDLERYRTSSPIFMLNLPENNVLNVSTGVALAMSDSYSFIIAPPPPGEYTIVVSGVLPDGWVPQSAAHVIVQAPQVIEPEATPAAATPVATPEA